MDYFKEVRQNENIKNNFYKDCMGKKMKKLLKRTWVYAMTPQTYEMACDQCGGNNITWSEYKGMIWCYKCKIDTPGTGGMFDDPIPLEVCNLFGITFDRIDLKTRRLKRMTKTKTGKLIWRSIKKEKKVKR